MSHQHKTLEDTVYFWFGSNDTGGSGDDGASAVFDVRLAGAAAGTIPTLSGSGTLLSHANYPDGCYEVAVPATDANGFAANGTYAVFCTLLVDSENPTGFVGSFILAPISSTVSDKTGFSLSTAGILGIWDQLTAAVVTASTMGKLIIDFLNAAISSRAPAGEYNTQLDANMSSRATSAKQDTMETTLNAVPGNVWDEILTGASHNDPTSAGRRLRTSDRTILSDTAQGPGAGNNQIQLNAGASAVDGAYDPSGIEIIGGTGVGQTRLILEYDGTSKTATVDRNWKVNPANDSEFVIYGDAGRQGVNEGLAQAGSTSSTIKLNALASSADEAYKNQIVFIRSGTGEDQSRRIASYDGASQTATVSRAWDITPDATSAYVMIPMSCVEVQAVKDTELTVTSGTNFETFFGNDGDASTMEIDILELLEADTVIDTSNAAQWVLVFNKKGTSTEIMRKNMVDINGAAITSTSAVVGAHTHTV